MEVAFGFGAVETQGVSASLRIEVGGLDDGELKGIDFTQAGVDIVPDTYTSDGLADGMTALSAWFDIAAAALSDFSGRVSDLSPAPIRCWTHHYDIANEVNFQASGPDNVTTIGLGFSPGDENYDEPYFYVSPWSAIDQSELPAPTVTGHWHTEGFVGIVATASEILSVDDMASEIVELFDEAFAHCRGKP